MKEKIMDEIHDADEKWMIHVRNFTKAEKDIRKGGLYIFMFCYIIGLLFTGIFSATTSDKLNIETKMIIELLVFVAIIIGGIVICVKRKIRFYKAEEIVEILKDKISMNFLGLKIGALHDAKENLSKNKEMEMIKELSKNYEIKEKPFDTKNLDERIAYAKEEVSKKEEELRDITYKYVLSDASYQFRSKKDLVFQSIMHSIFMYMACFMLLALPMMMVMDKSENASLTWIPLVVPLIPTFVLIGIKIWTTRQDMKAFKILNTCDLPAKPDYMECYQLKINMEDAQKTYQNFVEIAYDFFKRAEKAKENSN